MLTRCPHCGATFRVTEAHLNAAHGKVRCGACMAIFNATEHLLKTPDAVPAASPEPAAEPRREPRFEDEPETAAADAVADTDTDTDTDTDNFLIDDDTPLPDEDLTDADLVAELEAALNQQQAVSVTSDRTTTGHLNPAQDLDALLAEEEQAHGALAEHLHDLDEQALADAELNAILAPASEEELTAEMEPSAKEEPSAEEAQAAHRDFAADDQLLSDEDDEQFVFQDNPEEDRSEGRYSGLRLSEDELSDSFRDLDRPSQTAFSEDADTELEKAESDESWAEEMLDEIEGRKPASPAPSVAPPSVPPSVPPSAPYSDPLSASVAGHAPLSLSLEPDLKPQPAPHAPIEPLAAYDRLKYDPIRVEDEGAKPGSLLRVLAWTLANILLLVALAAQLGWFHFDRLAHHEGLRTFYTEACQRLGCALPTLLDIDRIKSNNLVVRSHPEAGKALVIDVMVTNEAPFDQPFPNITFQFADLNGKPVAQRVFTPEEYLRGEFRDLKLMPSDRPVHVTLEVLDPGPDAVNYTMGFSHHPGSNS